MKDCDGTVVGQRAAARIRWPVALLMGLLGLAPSASGQQVPPQERYRTFDTEHFRVTFAPGLEEPARRAAGVAEDAHALLRETFFEPPAGPIDLLLSDHLDTSNGFALVTPSNRIVLWVHPPVDGLALTHLDDWLELVVTHELAHIFHLDYTGPLGRGLRRVFGRVPHRWPYFMGFTLPVAAIEGVAVHLESLHTEGGRLDGTYQAAILRGQALEGALERVDRGLGRSPVWPGGTRPYAYGAGFFRYLAREHGEEAVARFLRTAADQWIPYRLDAASREAFGQSFEELWESWAEEVEREAFALRAEVSRREAAEPPERLTDGARFALHPAPAPTGGGGEGEVAYVRSDGRTDTRLVLRTSNGERTLSRWNDLAPPSWTPDGELLVPQAEFLDLHRVHRDLYRVSREGRVVRLTRGLRVLHAHSHPGDGTIVAVLSQGGINRLVVLDGDGEVARVLHEPEPGVLWSHPSWSPDGERLAVARRGPGRGTAILVLDADGQLLHTVVEDGSLNTSPAWGPEGRTLLWSSDRDGVPNLYGVRLGAQGGAHGPVLQITDLETAGTFPAIDPDGERIYFSLLGSEGWELARIPHRPDDWFLPHGAPAPEVATGAGDGGGSEMGGETRSYSALPTLLPRYWTPIHSEPRYFGGTRVLPRSWGVRTSGRDLVGRHRYSARATVSMPDLERRLEWSGWYAWAGLGRPVLSLDAGQSWHVLFPLDLAGGEGEAADTAFVAARERHLGAAVELRRQRIRSSAYVTLGGRGIERERTFLDEGGRERPDRREERPSGTLAEARLAAGFSTARAHPFSISVEDGFSVSLSVRNRWEPGLPEPFGGVRGLDPGFREAVFGVRAYRGLSGFGSSNQVLAFRAAGGIAGGPGAGDAPFAVGGEQGLFPVRGHRTGVLFGRSAWGVTGEWRFPLGFVRRGFGAWPVYLDRAAGALFVDLAGASAGSARMGGPPVRSGTRGSAGVELVLFHSRLFEALERTRVGVAIPFDGPGSGALYLRSGWAF